MIFQSAREFSVRSVLIERYEATLKELTSFKERYHENLSHWKADEQHARTKRCSSSPGLGIKKSRGAACADINKPSAAKTSLRRIKLIMPSVCSALNSSTPSNVFKTIAKASSSAFSKLPSESAIIQQHATTTITVLSITVLSLHRLVIHRLFSPQRTILVNQSQRLLDSKYLRESLGANQQSSPNSGLNPFKQACHWLGVIKAIAPCSRGFSRGP